MAILDVNKLCVHFGGLEAVCGFSISLEHGELVGLIGPNGAGKTTVFNALTGLCDIVSGDIMFGDENLTRYPAHKISRSGIARTFQNIRLFRGLTVLDNVKIACHQHCEYNMLNAIARFPRVYEVEREFTEASQKLLEVVGLGDKASELAGNLAYGEQRRLEIARALATKPKLLLLDEPAAGMNPQETKELVQLIRKLQKDFDLTIFLIEHDMSLVMSLCERICVLDYGVQIAEGTPQEISSNPRVIEAYLGQEVEQC